jgi:hypothetical protein
MERAKFICIMKVRTVHAAESTHCTKSDAARFPTDTIDTLSFDGNIDVMTDR